eukprot:CAMPEP_0197592706 /NCGR_PEP_ID=MMETSP1326-20131121/15289_1 /TAXON_ID=1155430 /ORGANISM="Genus nov. species nov., Strain RCC2288" /LENGTH=108 /DNA_ID=CAMNT_0043158435 /DNA_START=328 /DNA_END=650 /DNA_ORIENTATION=-
MAEINLDALKATLAKTLAGLPEVLRSCSVETLVNDMCPIFTDEDYKRAPNVTSEHLSFSEKWVGLLMALQDPRQSSADATRELDTAAGVLEDNIKAADESMVIDEEEG